MKIYIADNYNCGIPSNKLDYMLNEKIMKKYEIETVNKIKNCDLIIAFKIDCEILFYKKPIIICERFDSISVGSVQRCYKSDNVVAIFKDYLPRNIQLLTDNTVKKRYHYNILNYIYGFEEKQENNEIIESYLEKFKLVPWCVNQYSHLALNKHIKYCLENNTNFEKDIDIFCVCHSHENISPLNKHRIEIKKLVKQLSNDFIVYSEENINTTLYNNNLLRSKIVVAPWGFGERIAADQKAIIGNCVLIKPDTNHVITIPDLYQDSCYVKCKQDLSDLKDICVEVLKNYDLYFQKTKNAQKLFSETTLDFYQDNFWKNIIQL